MCNSSHGDGFHSSLSAGDDGRLGQTASVAAMKGCVRGRVGAAPASQSQAGVRTVRGDWLVTEQISADQCSVHDECALRHTQLQLTLSAVISVCLQSDRWPSLRSADSALL